MFIIIPLGMKYTARTWGSAIKHVTCAHCQTQFVYEIRRAAAYNTSAVAYIGKASAQQRAVAGAHKSLQKALDREHDLIPCPKCLRLQPAMNRAARKFYLACIFGFWIAAAIVWFMAYESVEARHDNTPAWANILLAVSSLVAVTLSVLVCLKEFRAAATDRAQFLAEAQAQNFARLYLPRILKDGWLWTRATLFESPALCASCGSPSADHTLSRRLIQSNQQIDARVCSACNRRISRKRLLAGALLFLAGFPIIITLFLLVSNWELSEILGWSICLGPLVGSILLAFAQLLLFNNRFGFPIRFRNHRLRQDSIELRFQSPAATEAFLASAITRMQAALDQSTPIP